jgi:hypothetical protein
MRIPLSILETWDIQELDHRMKTQNPKNGLGGISTQNGSSPIKNRVLFYTFFPIECCFSGSNARARDKFCRVVNINIKRLEDKVKSIFCVASLCL